MSLAYFLIPSTKISCLSLKYWYTITVEIPAALAISAVLVL